MSANQNLEFYVGNFRVDIQRNQIIHENNIIALEPKVLEVLKVLAEFQGEVVSQQYLLDKVWPDIVVAPNALQRCIGQLRKALNDDGKKQSVIVTHPKRGYSLIQQVRFERSQSAEPNADKLGFSPVTRVVMLLTVLLTIILIWGLTRDSKSEHISLSEFNKLVPLTATDTSEFYSVFSPDGQYVAFSRAETSTGSHIWLKELASSREIQLTKKSRHYAQPNWSSDGKHIAFLQRCTSDCEKPSCFNLSTLYVPLALSQPKNVETLLKCIDMPLQGLQWIDDKRLVYIENLPEKRVIKILDTQSLKEQEIYATSTHYPYALSYSFANNKLAVMQESDELAIELFLLDPNSGGLTQLPFTSPAAYGSWLRWHPVWNNRGDGFLFSGANHMYQMDLTGKLTAAQVTTFEDISRPMFHPDGTSIAMTLGKVDRDLVEFKLNPQNVQNSKLGHEQVLARSIMRESSGAYQPNGKATAFLSDRSGQRQLWLLTENGSVNHLSSAEAIDYFVWSPTGEQLAASSARQIFLFDKRGQIQNIPTEFEVMRLFQWTADDLLLLQILDESGPKLATFNFKTKQLVPVSETQVGWAQLIDNELWYTNLTGDLMMASGSENIVLLEDIRIKSRFLLRGQSVYFLQRDGWLSRFDLSTKAVKRLSRYSNGTLAFGDIKQDETAMLASRHVRGKKEIVLLQPSN